jgi:hypothetical protein
LTASDTDLYGLLRLTGDRLGGPDDSIFVSFYQEGTVVLTVEAAGTTQATLDVNVAADQAIPPGTYRIILRVNGEQAINSPEVSWTCVL